MNGKASALKQWHATLDAIQRPRVLFRTHARKPLIVNQTNCTSASPQVPQNHALIPHQPTRQQMSPQNRTLIPHQPTLQQMSTTRHQRRCIGNHCMHGHEIIPRLHNGRRSTSMARLTCPQTPTIRRPSRVYETCARTCRVHRIPYQFRAQ